MAPLITYFNIFIRHKLARNASWMLIGKSANFLFQAAYFVLLARLLGVREYGIFAGIFAIVNTIAPYSALGAAMLLLRYVSIDQEVANKYWSNALATTAGFTLLAVICVLPLAAWLHIVGNPTMVVSLVLANCLFSQITQLGSLLVFALGNARLSALMSTVSNLCRLLVLVMMKVWMGHATATQWSVGVLIASFTSALGVYHLVRTRLGPVSFDSALLWRRFWEGLGFSVAGTTDVVNNDVDKILLAHYQMDVQNGFYTLAYRVIDFSTSPIGALNAAVMQRHFALSPGGIRPIKRLAAKSLCASIVLGVAIALALRFGSALIPMMAGKSYLEAASVLNILCILPLIRSVNLLCGSAVTGLGHQNWRTGTQAVAALLNVALNLMWIPKFGWHGAAWSTLASDGTLAVLNAGLLLLIIRFARQNISLSTGVSLKEVQ
ncbi:MAG: oligosaccharide flippase family protein [Terracidiphilus sp.]